MEYFVWMTTRKIRAGALDDFEHVWQPNPYPEGLARAYAYWSEDGQEIIGVSFWDTKESCDAWRDSEAENGVAKQWRPTCSKPEKRSTEVANWAFLAGRGSSSRRSTSCAFISTPTWAATPNPRDC